MGYLSALLLGRASYVVAVSLGARTVSSGAVHASLLPLAIIISMWKMVLCSENGEGEGVCQCDLELRASAYLKFMVGFLFPGYA